MNHFQGLLVQEKKVDFYYAQWCVICGNESGSTYNENLRKKDGILWLTLIL